MKIGVVTSVYALSETDRHASFLVESTRHLVARGHEVKVFAPSYEGCRSHSVQGVPVHRFRYFPRRWENLTHGEGAPNRIRNPLYLFVAAFYILFGLIGLLRFCRAERFDVLHVHWPFPHGIWGLAAARLFGIPMVLTFHGAELLLTRRFPFVAPVLRLICRNADGIVCNSNFTAGQVRRYTSKPVNVIPFGATVMARAADRDPAKPLKDILYVGRLIERKGVDYLIDAMPLILRHLPTRLHIVGDGPMAEPWRARAANADLSERVAFHGIVPNDRLEALYASSDLFVLPAIVDDRGDTEGQGVVLVEAMSFAMPVVACEVGGIPDVVLSGITGLLVPQRSPDELAKAIIAVLSDPALAARFGAAGLAHAQDYFSWDRITGLLEATYRNAVGTPSGAVRATA
ncbi:MAG: glycosyltransferase family 4 protein [Alphaproteobacteria bacterium]|nr:glycosyltransferase family 4 protein [Alphaproteobacteria bacterium]